MELLKVLQMLKVLYGTIFFFFHIWKVLYGTIKGSSDVEGSLWNY